MEIAFHGVLASALLVAVVTWSYRSLRGPLAKLPGPWYTMLTDWVSVYHTLIDKKVEYVHELHRTYGPLVRISPSEISVQDVSAVRRLYRIGRGEFRKAAFYQRLSTAVPNVFMTTDPDDHRRKRRLLSAGVSESGLMQHKHVVDGKVQLALKRMRDEQHRQGFTDVFRWWLAFSGDVVCELSFGDSFGMLDTAEENQFMHDLAALGGRPPLHATFPTFARVVRTLNIPIPGVKNAIAIRTRIREYGREALDKHFRFVSANGEADRPTVLSRLYQAGEDGLPFEELREEGLAYIVAGSGTMTNTLTYLVWTVCKHPKIQSRLVEELGSLPKVFDDSDLKKLTYLNHVIDETLRLYPGAPGGLPRETPEEGVELSGHWIPGGTTVSAQAWSMHRNEEAFADANLFNPDRWNAVSRSMQDSFVPFGGGSRVCLGIHLARLELRFAAARFFLAFPHAKPAAQDGFGDKDMEPELRFTLAPKGRRCLISLE